MVSLDNLIQPNSFHPQSNANLSVFPGSYISQMTPQLQPSLPNSNINNSFGTNPFGSTQTQFPQSSAESNNNSANLAASSVIVGDPSWYLDSGATNHVIVDGQSLLQQFDYNGKNKLLVGNGQGLNISGIGNTVIMSCLSTVSYPIHLKEVLVVHR